jgi:hypothetical protein
MAIAGMKTRAVPSIMTQIKHFLRNLIRKFFSFLPYPTGLGARPRITRIQSLDSLELLEWNQGLYFCPGKPRPTRYDLFRHGQGRSLQSLSLLEQKGYWFKANTLPLPILQLKLHFGIRA